ncbi:MAG: hypothetical protein QNI96_05055 [Woeseiaceae bacterium]|nr:hypothetical protein [Woeseiaceae bacterium]
MDTTRTPIREYGLGGIIRDVRPWDVPANSFTTLNNVRIEDASLSTLGDISTAFGPFTADDVGGEIKPVYGAPFWIDGGNVVILVFDNGEVRSYSQTNPTAAYVLQRTGLNTSAPFYHTQSGEYFHLTSKTNDPQTLAAADANTANSMVNMPGWPDNYRCGILESYKNTLVAADITVSGSDRPNLVKWSDIFVEGDTAWRWDPADATIVAGENPIQSNGQGINAMKPLRDSLMIYFDRSMWRMDLVGGQLVMQFRKVFNDDGAQSKYAVDSLGGRALVVGIRDIYLHDGVQKQSLSDGKLTRAFFSSLQRNYPVRVLRYALRNETWITYRDRTDGEANRALVYNSLHNSFTPVDLTNPTSSVGDFVGLFTGPRLSSSVTTYADISASLPEPNGPDYNAFNTISYADVYSTAEDTVFYGLSDTPGVVLDLDAITGDARFRLNTFIEHSRIDLDEWLQTSGDKVVYISRLYPQYSGKGRLEIRFGVAATTSSSIEWGDWQEFDLASDYAIDFRSAGRFLAYQIRPFTAEAPSFACSGMDMEWAVIGEQ